MGLFRKRSGTTPMGVYVGRVPNRNTFYGQQDLETQAQTQILNGHDFLRIQLSNGWDRTSYGLRQNFAGGYLAFQTPYSPGLSRMQGQNPTDFMPQGASPSQWQDHYMATAGAQPDYPGGPGYILGRLYNPGSGA